MDNKKNFELYIDDNFQSCKKNPIEWMEIKDKNDSNFLLFRIPFSPLIQTDSFQNAIYKQKIFIPNSKQDCILQSIKTLYNNKRVYFSKTFLDIIKKFDNETILTLNINYNLDDEKFTYSHLYFLNFLANNLSSVNNVTSNNMTIEINTKDLI